MPGFDYAKWDNIELSDDEEDVHPNIDKDSWFRLKHRTRVEREEDEGKERGGIEEKLKKLRKDLSVFGAAGKEHTQAKKLQKEIDVLEAKTAKMDKERKWNADNMCKTVDARTEVNSSSGRSEPKPEPRLKGEEMAEGYCEFIEKHEDLLETYISLGGDDFEKVGEFLKEHGGTLLVGEHAESYLLLDCLEKEMNGEHFEMTKAARQNQILVQLREFSRAAGRPVRDAVHPIFEKLLNDESTREAFNEAVQRFITRVELRAVDKKKEMDAEEDGEDGLLNPLGPGGLDPMEVFHTLPDAMQQAFRSQDMQRLHAVIESLPEEEAKRHLKRCEESGLWVPNPEAGPPPYRGDGDD